MQETLRYLANCIAFMDEIKALPTCNDCAGAKEGCEYVPEWGEHVRYNCPLWREKERSVK